MNEIQLTYTDIISSDTEKAGITLKMARFDLIHPVISGNKLFKLYYFMEQTLQAGKTHFVTAGGAYSNHLAATAHFCKLNCIRCTGFIRGEESKRQSHTLNYCREMGMELIFLERNVYDELDENKAGNILGLVQSEFTFIPSGGFHPLGAKGAALMFEKIKEEKPTHIVMAMGTGTTLSGFMLANNKDIELIGVSALKGMNDWEDRWRFLIPSGIYQSPTIWDQFHCGGYAKHDDGLISTMNELYHAHGIETDFVYTGKMMLALFQQIQLPYFKPGSKVICIHTGGLQGNISLPGGLLAF